jgi:hypothetical protein
MAAGRTPEARAGDLMPRRLGSIAAFSLALALSLSSCAALHIGGRHAALPSDPDPANPDLEMAELVVDGQALGHIPVTVQFDEKRDYRLTFTIEGLGEKSYLLRNRATGATFTIDMIGGQPAAIDDSTGAWEVLEFESGGWGRTEAVEAQSRSSR